MEPVYQEILNEKEPSLRLILADTLQSLLLVTTQTILFPVIAFIDIYKTYLHCKKYQREKNKNIRKKSLLAIRLLTTLARVAASVALVSAYAGTQLLAANIISFIFLGAITTQCLSHLAQTIYHGIRWLCSDRDSKKNEKHKMQFHYHFKSTIVLGAISASFVTSLFFPAFHLVTWSVGMGIVGLHALKTGYSVCKIQQQKNQQIKEWQEKYNQARMIRHQARSGLIDKTLENVEGPSPIEDKTRAYFPDQTLRMKYKNYQPNLDQDDVKDLVRAMEAMDEIDGPKKFILALLRQSIDAILKNLNVDYCCDEKTKQLELDKNGCLPTLWNKNFSLKAYVQQTKLKDKLHAVLSLEMLIIHPKKSLIILEKNKRSIIDTVYDLTHYLKKNNKIENVFQSSLCDSKIKKLFALVDYYLNHPDLQPETRRSYEEMSRFRVTPIRTRLATPY